MPLSISNGLKKWLFLGQNSVCKEIAGSQKYPNMYERLTNEHFIPYHLHLTKKVLTNAIFMIWSRLFVQHTVCTETAGSKITSICTRDSKMTIFSHYYHHLQRKVPRNPIINQFSGILAVFDSFFVPKQCKKIA